MTQRTRSLTDPEPVPPPEPPAPHLQYRLSDVFSYKRTEDGALLKVAGNATWEEQARLGIRRRDWGPRFLESPPGWPQADPVPPRRKPGRPLGSGLCGTQTKFLAVVRPIIAQLHDAGKDPTVPLVVSLLPQDPPYTIRHFYRLTWRHTKMSWANFVQQELMSLLCQ
jgi:hypothetical protein